jgi:hypothetical protein
LDIAQVAVKWEEILANTTKKLKCDKNNLGYQQSPQIRHQLQQPTTGIKMQYMPCNQQIPMLVNNSLLVNHPIAHSQTFAGQNFANLYTPTAYMSLSDDEELDANPTEHTNNNPWQAIKKRKLASNKIPHTTSFQLDTSNQYKELHVEEHTGAEENLGTHTIPETSNQQSKEPKPPPIYVHGVTNYKAMVNSLAAATATETYHSKTLSDNTVIIYPDTPETYRRLVSHLHDKKIIFHTYQLKQERAYRIVIRDIHPSVSPQ